MAEDTYSPTGTPLSTQPTPPLAKRLANSASIYAASMFLGRLTSIVMLPVYTRYLSPADYGVLELTEVSVLAIATFLGMGLTGDALYYFYARATSEEQRENLVNGLLLLSLAGGLAGGLLLVAGSGWLSEILFHSTHYQTALQIAAVTFILSMPIETGLAYVRARDQAKVYLGFSLFRLASGVLLNVVFLIWLGLGFYSILLTSLLTNALSFLGFLWYLYRGFGRWRMPVFSPLWPVVKYSVPLGLGGLGMLAIHFGDRYFLSRSTTLAEIGIYSLAYKFGMMLGYLNLPLVMFWRSQVHHIMKDGNEKGEAAFVRMFTFVAVFFGFAAYCLAVLAPLVIKLIAGPAFQNAAIFVPWLTAAYLLEVLTSQLASGLLVGNKTKWLMASHWMGTVVCLAGYAVLIPLYRVWGAVASTFLAFLVMFVSTVFVSQRLKPRVFEIRKISAAYGLLIGLFLLARVVPPAPGAAGMAVTVAFAPLALLLLGLLPMLSEERILLLGFVRSFRPPDASISQ